MDWDNIIDNCQSFVTRHQVHCIVFLIVFFTALTFLHPVIILNDEWITVNQMSQLHAGHQVIINEGKFGLWENGTISQYFEKKSNILAYSVFQPLISIPAFWMIDLTGAHYPFFLLYLWSMAGFILILYAGYLFQNHIFLKKYWAGLFFVFGAFLLFFINLYYYVSFPVSTTDALNAAPEVAAIVLTNLILLSISAVLIYDINYSFFNETGYSFFGTVVTLSCSSFFFWVTGCKDHVLVFFIFTAVLFSIVKFHKGRDLWFFTLAFLFSGLLAWARPELAFFVFLALCLYWLHIFYHCRSTKRATTEYLKFFSAPFFTLIGALPFFTNNLMVTKNIFLPAWILWSDTNFVSTSGESISGSVISISGGNPFNTIFGLFRKMVVIDPSTFFGDLVGVFTHAENGSIGIFSLCPLFLVTLVVITILVVMKRVQVSPDEKNDIFLILLMAAAVFITYAIEIRSLNISHGVIPDIRYLSPIYLPLNLLGLIFFRKLSAVSGRYIMILKMIVVLWVIEIPISLVLVSQYYRDYQNQVSYLKGLNAGFSMILLTACIFLVLLIIYCELNQKRVIITSFGIAILCSLPVIWQINASFLLRVFSTGAGYSYIIPVVRVIYQIIVTNFLII